MSHFDGFGSGFNFGDMPPAVAQKLAAQQMKMPSPVQRPGATPASSPVKPSAINAVLPSQLHAGNVGNMNSVIWPFYFTTDVITLGPNQSLECTVTVTQEAAFILMQVTKTVFKRTGAPGAFIYTAIDPEDSRIENAYAEGLKVSLRDAQSTRSFMQRPIPIDMIGSAAFPTIMPAPQMFLPNATIIADMSNESATETFIPRLTFFGYRVRVTDARSLLSLVTG